MNNIKNISLLVSMRYTVAIVFLVLSVIGYSQSPDSTTIISITDFKPFLTDAFKIKDNPSIKDTHKVIPTLNYQFLTKQVPVTFNIDTIKPAKIKGEPLIKLYRGYAKAGFGTNGTPLMEIYYNSKRSKKMSYGFAGKHFSSRGISNVDYSGFSDNYLSAFGKSYSKEFTLYGNLTYNRNVNHYYGFPEENTALITNEDNVEQTLHKIRAAASFARNYTDSSQFDYNVDLNYYNINDAFRVSENHFEFAGKLSKYHDNELFAIGMEMNYNNLINSIDQDNNLVLGINPHVSTKSNNWEFQVGIGLFLNSYPDTKFHFYPQAEFKYNVVEHIIIPYVGIEGGLISNNLNNFYSENPFINTQILLAQNSNQKYKFYAGIRGNLSSKLTFNTSFSHEKIEGLPMYTRDFSNLIENQFIIEYDTAKFSKVTGELSYQELEKLKVSLHGAYFNYDLRNEIKAWHKPNLKLTLIGIYDLSDKILARVDFFYISKQYAKILQTITTNNVSTTTEDAIDIDGVFDANIGLEYRYTKKLSAFINFNNILSTKYYRWQDYPTQRFGVLGGLTYSF